MYRFKADNNTSSDLLNRVDRALDFAEAAIGLVQIDELGIDLQTYEAPLDKIIAETAMLLRSIILIPASSGSGVQNRARELINLLLPFARHQRIKVSISLFPALAVDYAAAHLVLGKADYQDFEFDKILAESLKATTSNARERLPHRELEQAWLLSRNEARNTPKEMITRTSLFRGVDVISGSRDDIYAFTHALMYATDFGNSDPPKWWPKDDILSLAEGVLIGQLDEDDFDLAGEILLTWPFLKFSLFENSAFAFAFICFLEDQVGVLPSLSLSAKEYEQLSGQARKQYTVATSYHTAYVMGLLCSSLLRDNNLQAAKEINKTGSALLTQNIFNSLSQDEKKPQWMTYFRGLDSDNQNIYFSFVLQVAIRRAIRCTKFQEARDLLKIAYDTGHASSKICLQAAEILHRLAQYV